jgi:hypothetical protein
MKNSARVQSVSPKKIASLVTAFYKAALDAPTAWDSIAPSFPTCRWMVVGGCDPSTACLRGLIGFQGEFLTMTRGTGLMSDVFDGFAPVKGDSPGVATVMFVSPGEKLYEGMIIGSRENDLVMNPIKTKQLTNIWAASS